VLVSWDEIKDPRNVPYAQKAYFSQICSHPCQWAFLIRQDSPTTQCHRCLTLRECAISTLTARMSTRGVQRIEC
jgi:hypothetical protein